MESRREKFNFVVWLGGSLTLPWGHRGGWMVGGQRSRGAKATCHGSCYRAFEKYKDTIHQTF